MGGTLAMMIAARHPAAVGRVMVVDMLPAPAGLLGSSAEAIRPLADALAGVLTSSPGGRQLLESLVGGFGASDDAARSDSDVVARAMHRSEEHTSELQSLMRISYAVFCLKKQKN